MSAPTVARFCASASSSALDVAAMPTYIGPADRQVFAWYHAPPAAAARDCAVVLCAPIANESTGVHRAFRHWAEALAAAGFPVVRFDYHGFGDSAGAPGDAGRLRAWLDSVGDAIAFAREASGAQRVALAGLHLGATLALAAAAERGDVDALVLWVPYPTGRAYLREGRAFTQLMASALDPKQNPLPAGAEQIGGLRLSAETLEELNTFDPLAGGRRVALPALLIPRDAAASDAAVVRALTSAGATVERERVEGYAGVMTEPHQSTVPSAVIDATTRWLSARFARGASPDDGASARPAASAVVAAPEAFAKGSQAVVESPLCAGDELFGILSRPAGGATRATGILLVNAGAVYRVGPNRVYVDLARRWASLGYTVLRMDVGGLGDSATPADGEENHSYPSHAVRDIEVGIGTLRQHGAERVVVGGLCSGAHAAFHAGCAIDSLDGVIVINPIVFYWKPSDPLDIGTWMAYIESRRYKRSVRSWRSWRRLLQGRVNVPHVAGVGVGRVSEVVKAKVASIVRRVKGDDGRAENAARDLARIAKRGTDVMLLFSAGDPGLDFLQLRYDGELRKLERASNFRLVVIDHADHTFTAAAARQHAVDALTEHLVARHP